MSHLRELGSPPSNTERLLLWRRRLNMSQEEAAKHFGVSMRTFTGWEYGTKGGVPKVALGRLEAYEVCFLYRRRAGMNVTTLASDLGCTAYWVTRIERGREPSSVSTLLEYWEC